MLLGYKLDSFNKWPSKPVKGVRPWPQRLWYSNLQILCNQFTKYPSKNRSSEGLISANICFVCTKRDLANGGPKTQAKKTIKGMPCLESLSKKQPQFLWMIEHIVFSHCRSLRESVSTTEPGVSVFSISLISFLYLFLYL